MPIKLLLFETTPESFYDLELFGETSYLQINKK